MSPPPSTFRKPPPPLLLRHIKEKNSLFMGSNRSHSISLSAIWLKLKLGSSAHVCLRSSLGTLCTCRLSKNKPYLKRKGKQEKQTSETHCTFLLRLRHVVHIVMYHLKATLYVTVCLAGFVTKTYGEQKSWPNFVFRSSVNRNTHHAKKRQQIGFEFEQKYYFSSENYFSKKLLDMTLVSMSVSTL